MECSNSCPWPKDCIHIYTPDPFSLTEGGFWGRDYYSYHALTQNLYNVVSYIPYSAVGATINIELLWFFMVPQMYTFQWPTPAINCHKVFIRMTHPLDCQVCRTSVHHSANSINGIIHIVKKLNAH